MLFMVYSANTKQLFILEYAEKQNVRKLLIWRDVQVDGGVRWFESERETR